MVLLAENGRGKIRLTGDRLFRLFLVITNRCNARCKLCDYWKTGKKAEKFLNPAFIREKIVPLIHRRHIAATVVSGGEPTLHPNLPEILKILEETGTIITLVTNGTGLPAVWEKVKDHVHAWLLSLDAGDKERYEEIRGLDNFEDLLTWPGRIKSHNPAAKIAFNCLLQKKNVRHLVPLYELAAGLPCDAIFFNAPDLRPDCFARTGEGENYRQFALLDDEEIVALEENLAKMQELDRDRFKLMQGEQFFADCVTYFRYLRGEEMELNRGRTCEVPFHSLVVDEGQRAHSCFYLPDGDGLSFELNPEGRLPENYFENIRGYLTAPPAGVHPCAYCLQFQG